MKISVLIPCHNEELSIERCIESCLGQSRKPDQIVVVNDCSLDRTPAILKRFKKRIKVINLPVKTGNKSYAQEQGMKFVTGDIVVTTDADSVLDKNFIKNIIKEFDDPKVVASAGYVKSMNQNWLTACRQIDYLISQEIHKKAQSILSALYVMPGCATAYRTKIFKKIIKFDHDTVTEDLDFTYKYHQNNLKITFAEKAVVYTQDPSTLHDYVTQMRRWHAGNWQNLLKHFDVMKNPGNALELSLIYLEGLFFPLLLLLALILNFQVFIFFSLTYSVIIAIFASIGWKKDKRPELMLHIPTYFVVSFINYAIFIEQFIHEVVLMKGNLHWVQPVRKEIYS